MDDKPSVAAHLLVSVYVTPRALAFQNYDLAAVPGSGGEFFRLERFATMLSTLGSLDWLSVCINYELDPEWSNFYPEVDAHIRSLFLANLEISHSRFESASEWLKAASRYDPQALIFLNSNDDHALLAPEEFVNFADQMLASKAVLGLVTHFPEFKGMQYRRFQHLRNPGRCNVGYALGTTLVSGGFFQSWWEAYLRAYPGSRIVRPDNPFGPSVTFAPTLAALPNTELVRHMDGYSHVGVGYPAGPLRNLFTLDESTLGLIQTEPTFTAGKWPARIQTRDGYGSDLLELPQSWSVVIGVRLRESVAIVKLAWSFRVAVFDVVQLLKPKSIGQWMTAGLSAVLALASRAGLVRLFDYVFDYPVLLVLRTLGAFGFTRLERIAGRIWYLGAWRFLTSELQRVSRPCEGR